MDLTHFQSHGYQVLPGVIDRETVRSLLTYLAADADDALTLLMADLRCNDVTTLCKRIDETASRPDFDKVPKDQRLVMSGHFPLETRLSRTLWQVPKLAAVRAVLEHVLGGSDLFMHMPPTARFVLPGNKHAAVPAHQDISYNKHMADFVTLWVPLTRIDDQCGGVAVFPGSGQPVERLESFDQKFWLQGVSTEGFPRVHCTMDAGDALLLNKWIIHESVANLSSRIRYSIDFRFFRGRDQSSKHLLDLQNWRVIEPAKQTGIVVLANFNAPGQVAISGEKAAGMTIEEIFARHGETHFRDGERRVIARLLDGPPLVLATGGGAFMNPETRQRIKQGGVSIWLKADLDVLLKRCLRRTNRPLLQQGDPRDVLARLMTEREPVYAEADYVVASGDGPHEAVVEEIVALLGRRDVAPAPAEAGV